MGQSCQFSKLQQKIDLLPLSQQQNFGGCIGNDLNLSEPKKIGQKYLVIFKSYRLYQAFKFICQNS